MKELDQRLDWLAARIAELRLWRDREWRDLDGWTLDGAPHALGAPWPDRRGVHRFAHPRAEVPWPDARLRLDLGGEALVTLTYADGATASFGSDPEHRELPLQQQPFAVEAEAVARLPFGQPNRDARLATARVVRVDTVLETLVRRLELVLEAGRVLGSHDAVGALTDAAAHALRELEWPSATLPYLARLADTENLQNVWELPAGLEPRPPGLDSRAGGRAWTAAASSPTRSTRTWGPSPCGAGASVSPERRAARPRRATPACRRRPRATGTSCRSQAQR